MINWKAVLNESPIEWLLEKENPSVRYFTLCDVLERSQQDREVVATKKAIRDSRVVRKILEKQKLEGYWEEPTSPYFPKYKSSYWQVMTLGQLGMDKTDARVRKACEYIFKFQLGEGGFSCYSPEGGLGEYKAASQKGKKLPMQEDFVSSLVHEHQYSCLTGNMVGALVRMGYEENLRTKKALEWLVKIQNKDGGWLCPYWGAHIRDTHGCFNGTICPLEAFSLVKKESLTEEMRHMAERGAEFLLMHRLFKADHHGYKIINRSWLTLSFPVFYGYNILRGLDVLTRLGYVNDERMNDAVEALLQKRQKDGKWVLESSPVGRMQANIEVKGKPSKWITLIALRTLKRLG
jgi:hypothetical protein